MSTDAFECNSGLNMQNGKTCDWKVYGFFRGLGKSVFFYVKEELHGQEIFMPIAWEVDKI
jgi:hypothetical protein